MSEYPLGATAAIRAKVYDLTDPARAYMATRAAMSIAGLVLLACSLGMPAVAGSIAALGTAYPEFIELINKLFPPLLKGEIDDNIENC